MLVKNLCFLQENNAMSLELNYRNKLHEVVREVKKRLVRISVVCGNNSVSFVVQYISVFQH